MTAEPTRRPTGRKLPVRALLLGLLVLAALVVGALLLFGGDDDEQGSGGDVAQRIRDGRVLLGPREAPFAMRYPETWSLLRAQQLGEGDPPPLAGLRRDDRSGVLTVSVRGPVRGGIASLRRRLPGELRDRFPDFRLVTSRIIEVAGGRALYTSWVRTRSGRVQSNLVVPQGNRASYSVDAVLRGDAEVAAREVGAMLRTFDIVQR